MSFLSNHFYFLFIVLSSCYGCLERAKCIAYVHFIDKYSIDKRIQNKCLHQFRSLLNTFYFEFEIEYESLAIKIVIR